MEANVMRLAADGMKTIGRVMDVGGVATVTQDTKGLVKNILRQNPGATVQDLIDKYGKGTYLRIEATD